MASGNALASPLSAVTFVVLDLETTGASPTLDRITESGALKLRGGELLGRIDSLVDPGVPIPPMITLLPGITEALVVPAPRIGELLPTILEFLGDSVIVGHNIRFDCSFLDAALVTHGYPPLVNCRVDTIGMARRLVRDDVPNLRLHTLAQHLRTDTVPVHRAYADAAATAELFHTLLEHAATWGVLGLDDLVALPKIRVHSSTAKLGATTMVINTAEFLPGDFTRNADFSLPIERLKRAIRTAAGAEMTSFVDATRLATALLGNSICANIFMVGYAYQL